MLIDGVCIRWRGWIDLQRLDGNGCLEYDEERGRIEDAILKEQIEQYKMRMREFEERQRLYKLAQAEHQKKTASAISATATGPQPPPPLSQQPPPPSLPTPAATTATATSNISKSEVSLNRKKAILCIQFALEEMGKMCNGKIRTSGKDLQVFDTHRCGESTFRFKNSV